ncbi:MAG: transposase [Myxococcaceae bacterium]|nr:transposase [Myxococcaceae bacterium]
MGMSVGHPTPEKLRIAIVRAFHEQGMSYKEIAELLGIGEATVSRVLRRYRETGSVEPRPRGGGNFSPISGTAAAQLSALVEERPDMTLSELTEEFVKRTGVRTSRSSVGRALHRLGFTRKKSPSSRRSGTGRMSGSGGESWLRC